MSVGGAIEAGPARPGAAPADVPRPAFVVALRGWVAARWASLDAAPAGRRVPGTLVVASLALVVGLAASFYSVGNGSNLAYVDAQSHLTISRRIIDSKAPGFQQLGTVWLPLPHLLLLPFVQSLWLWKTGWAAALLGTLCLTAITASIYRVAARLGVGRIGRLAAVAVLLASPSLVYTSTTALTEPVLLMCLAATLAGLAHWATSRRRMSAGELAVFAGIPAGAGVMARYEGWALAAAGTAVVFFIVLRRGKGVREALKMATAFVTIPVVAVLWWATYNWTVYGKPLEFMTGQYSARAQQDTLNELGLLPTKGNPGLTFFSYDLAVLSAAGLVAIVLALIGALVAAWRHGLSDRGLILLLSVSGYAFSILSLTLGQTAINHARTLPPDWWNNRFSLVSLLPIALLAGLAVHALLRLPRVGRFVVPVGLVALALQVAWWAEDPDPRVGVIAEAGAVLQEPRQAARYLAEHYDGGGILIDETARGNAVLPMIGVPLRDYFNRAAGKQFGQALRDPRGHARWIFVNTERWTIAARRARRLDATDSVASSTGAALIQDDQSGIPLDSGPRDLVAGAMLRHPGFASGYEAVFSTSTHRIYRRIEP